MVIRRRKRRSRISSVGMFLIVIAGTLALLVLLRSMQTVAQVGLPTPEGQLGGAVSLPTEPPPAEITTPTPVVQLDIPDPDLCDAEPRTVDGMLALIATPAAEQATPVGHPAAAATPASGERASPMPATAPSEELDRPATAATVGQIQRTVRKIVACGNAGELLKVWAYFSDDYVRLSAQRQPALFNRTILTARAQAQGPRTDAMPRVSAVREMGDGRVSAIVVIPTASPLSVVANQTGTAVFTFVNERNGWLIDEIRESDGTGG